MEIVAEEGGTGELVIVGEVGKGDVGLQEVEAYLHDGVDVDGLFGGLSVMALHDVGQVAWCDAVFVGVEIDTARGAIVCLLRHHPRRGSGHHHSTLDEAYP